MADKTIKYQLSAEDRTGGAFASLTANMKAAHAQTMSLHAGLVGLAGVLTTGAFAMMVKSTIEATARFQDLAQEAGTTAERISRFEAPARLAGLGLDAVAAAMFKLTKAAQEAKDPSSAAAQAFRSIGISTEEVRKAKPDELFEKVNRQMALYSDGLNKNAVQMELFSKSGREMNKLSAQMAEMAQLNATVTNEQAEEADRLGDQLEELRMTSEKLYRDMVSMGVPAVNEIVKAFADAKREGGLLHGVFAAIEAGWEKLKGPPEDQMKRVLEDIALAEKSIRESGRTAYDLEALYAKRDALARQMFATELADQDRRAKAYLAGLKKGEPPFDPNAAKLVEAYKNEIAALEAEYSKLKGTGDLAAYMLKLQKGELGKLSEAEKEHLVDLKKRNLEEQQAIKTREELIRADNEYFKAMEAHKRIFESYEDAGKATIEQLEFEISLQGKSAEEIAKLTEMRRLDLEMRKAAAALPEDATSADIQRLLDANAAMKARIGTLKDTQAAFAGTQDLTRSWFEMLEGGFNAALGGAKSFTDYLKNTLMQVLYSLTVRPFLITIAASLGGMPNNAAANMLGGGNGVGSFSSIGSMFGPGGFGSLMTNGGLGTLFTAPGMGGGEGAMLWANSGYGGNPAMGGAGGSGMMGAGISAILGGLGGKFGAKGLGAGERGQQIGGITGSVGASIGFMIGGPIGAALGALGGALIGKFSDPDGLAMRTAWVGTDPKGDAGGFRWSSPFGDGGIFATKWFNQQYDAQITNFAKGIGQFDQQVARYLTPEQLAAIKGNLSGSKQYDFGMENTDPAAYLGKIFKDRLDVIFSAIDPKLKALVDGFEGTGEELAAFALQVLELKKVLDTTSIAGLTLENLQAMQGEGESLNDTLTRVVGGFEAINAVGQTQVSELEAMAKALDDLFGGIGENVPADIEAWKALSASIDLSTDAGRNLFQAMAQGAGTFAQLQQAVSNAIAGIWASAQSTLGGQFGATFARSRLESTYAEWQAMRGENFSFEQMLAHFQMFTPETLQQGIQATQAQYGAGGVALLQRLWSDYAAYMQALGSSTQTLTQNFQDFTPVVRDFADALAQARSGLADYLNASLVSDLSPLTPMEQYLEAKRQYDENLLLAQGGNADAINNVGGLRDTFLRISRSIYQSSGQYNTDFFSTFNQAAGLTQGAVTPYTAQAAQANTNQVVQALAGVVGALGDVLEVRDTEAGQKLDEVKAMLMRLGAGTLTNTNGALA